MAAEGVVDLSDLDPGGDVGVGPDAVRPQPDDMPGSNGAAGWVKVGTSSDPGGHAWPYVDDVPAGSGGGWKQT